MRKTFLLLLLLAFGVKAEILWKPEAITFELKQAHQLVGTGLVLLLKQRLEEGESGWTKSRIDVPDSWADAKLEMRHDTIYIAVGGREYYVNASNKGDLSFAILDGGKKTDQQLEDIWLNHASGT